MFGGFLSLLIVLVVVLLLGPFAVWGLGRRFGLAPSDAWSLAAMSFVAFGFFSLGMICLWPAVAYGGSTFIGVVGGVFVALSLGQLAELFLDLRRGRRRGRRP